MKRLFFVLAIQLAAQTKVDWIQQLSNNPMVDVRTYNFNPITPGGSLVVGNTTVTFARVPLGTNGTDSAHYLYVSGGTGTAEACLINGGTGVAGQASGQIILNCAHTHSGAWTVRSATTGIQEAWNARGSALYVLPEGSFTTYASAQLVLTGGKSVIFRGAGHSSSGGGTIINHTGVNALFVLSGDPTPYTQAGFESMAVVGTTSSGGAINCSSCYGLTLRDFLQTTSVGVGVICASCTDASIQNSSFNSNGSYGAQFTLIADVINVDHSQFFANCLTTSSACAGLYISGGFAINIRSSAFEGNGDSSVRVGAPPLIGAGVQIDSIFGLSFTGNYCERNPSACLRITTNARNFDISGNYMEEGGLVIESGAAHGSVRSNMFVVNTSPTLTVTGVVSSGGNCLFTTSAVHNFTIETFVTVTGVGGATGCNGQGMVTAVGSTTTFTTTQVFSGSYTSGGSLRQTGGLYVIPNNDITVTNNETEGIGGTTYAAGVYTPCALAAPLCAIYLAGIQLADGIGTAIASATTIAPTSRIHHITGTAAIVNITPPTSQANSFSGDFCAIPDGIFTTTNAGNIAIASTAVVGKRLCWSYDLATVKWYPSY